LNLNCLLHVFIKSRSAFAGYFVMESTLCIFLVFRVRCKSRLYVQYLVARRLFQLLNIPTCLSCFDALNIFQHSITEEIAFGFVYVKLLNWSQDFACSNRFVAGTGHLARRSVNGCHGNTDSKSSRSQKNIRINIRTKIIKELEYLNTLTRCCFTRG